MNRKDWSVDDISNISFIAYTILGKKYTKAEQFSILKAEGFTTAWNIDAVRKNYTAEDFIENLITYASQTLPYDIDGLVLCDSTYRNEDKYRPNACRAFKINQQLAETTIIDVVFDGPSKDGTHCPVAILDPVELGGATISRATLHNLDIIDQMNLKYGSKVKILRSGDVIPKIINVIENPSNSTDIVLPTVCNCCGEELVRDGVNLRCVNKNCKDQVLHRMTYFIKKLGVKSSSEKSLEKFGILKFNDLLKFSPNKKLKSQVKLYEELLTKVFTRSRQDLLSAMNFRGLSETLINKIVDFYGFDNIVNNNYVGLPDGVGEITLQKFKDDIDENLQFIDLIIADSRYNFITTNHASTTVKTNGMSVCFTGKLNTMSRSEAEKKAIDAGFEIKAVNKKLTYLVTNDTNTNSGKGKKARDLGITMISEQDFLKMISSSTLEQDVSDL